MGEARIMSLSHRYRQLAALIETLESHGLGVQQAEPLGNGESDQSPDDGFVVQLRVELPTDATAELFDVDRSGTVETPERPPVEPSTAPVGVRPATPAPGVAPDDGQPVNADGGTGHDDTGAAAEADSGGVDAAEPGMTGSEDTGAADDGGTGTAGDDTEPDTASVVDEDPDDEETGGVGDSSEADDAEREGNTEEADTTTTEDAVPCTHPDCDRTFDTARGMKIHRTKAHPLSELVDGERERAVHRDPDVLTRVYDEHDTFAEMTEALDVDVGAQAVRKQMIRHGIHEPGAKESTGETTAERTDDDGALDQSASTASGVDETDEGDDVDGTDGTAEVDGTGDVEPDVGLSSGTDAALDDDTPVADRVPDLDLPGSLSAQDLLVAVEEANTLYDVQRALDLDQKTTRDVLTEYDLLELVSGRAAAVGDREELKAEIGQRIRRTAT